jgi:hypothetical protein
LKSKIKYCTNFKAHYWQKLQISFTNVAHNVPTEKTFCHIAETLPGIGVFFVNLPACPAKEKWPIIRAYRSGAADAMRRGRIAFRFTGGNKDG